jgi:hypothetical protein
MMTNEVTTTTTGFAALTAEAKPIIEAALRRVEWRGPAPVLTKAISPADRAVLQRRLHAIEPVMKRAGGEYVATTMARMFSAFTSATLDLAEMKSKLRVYDVALSELPRWAISEVATGIVRGEYGELAFVPTPPQIAGWVKKKAAVLSGEAALIRRLLDAKVEPEASPEDRAAVSKRMRALIAEISAPTESGPTAPEPIAGHPAIPAGAAGEPEGSPE